MQLLTLPCYCATLRQLSRAITALYEEAFAGSGLHTTQYSALQVLASIPELSTTEIAQTMGLDQTTATRMLALLAKKKLIQAIRSVDRRRRPWILTASGASTVVKLRPTWLAAEKLVEKRLGREAAVALKQAAFTSATRLAGP